MAMWSAANSYAAPNLLSFYNSTSPFSSPSSSVYSPSSKIIHLALPEAAAAAASSQLRLQINGSPSRQLSMLKAHTVPYICSESNLNTKVDDLQRAKSVEELRETARRTLQSVSDPRAAMELIDTLQWLGICYHYEQDIDSWLDKLQYWDAPNDDLHATALRFRLLRQNARPVSSDFFQKFMVKNQDKKDMLSLYEASYLGASDEDVLLDAMKFAETELKSSDRSTWPYHLSRCINRALELPRHLRMQRLESRLYIDEYRKKKDHNVVLLQHAIIDYNQVQSQHQMELAEVSRWWKELGLIEKLGFARDRLVECYLWTIGIFPDPKYSSARIELAKTIALLTVIDDVFDMYGPMDELCLFTRAIQRWNLDEIEQLPEYMKICYMALYNTTNEIAFRVLKDQGRNIFPFLAKVWIDTIEAYMIEAKWFNNGNVPSVEDYLKNGVTTSGSYMALVHIFFLMGEELTTENVKLMTKPYPKLFSTSGAILRLWDDLGTSKEEQENGDNASIITSLLKDKNIACEEEAKEHIKGRIRNLWKDMNEELLGSLKTTLPLPLIKACFNMSRTSQIVYQHKEDSYLSSVKKFVDFILLESIDS